MGQIVFQSRSRLRPLAPSWIETPRRPNRMTSCPAATYARRPKNPATAFLRAVHDLRTKARKAIPANPARRSALDGDSGTASTRTAEAKAGATDAQVPGDASYHTLFKLPVVGGAGSSLPSATGSDEETSDVTVITSGTMIPGTRKLISVVAAGTNTAKGPLCQSNEPGLVPGPSLAYIAISIPAFRSKPWVYTPSVSRVMERALPLREISSPV